MGRHLPHPCGNEWKGVCLCWSSSLRGTFVLTVIPALFCPPCPGNIPPLFPWLPWPSLHCSHCPPNPQEQPLHPEGLPGHLSVCHYSLLTPGSVGDCSPKLSHLPLQVPSHFQILSQTRQLCLLGLFSNIDSLTGWHGLCVTLLEMFMAQCFQAKESLYLFTREMQSTAIFLRQGLRTHWGKQLKLIN